MWCCLLLCAHPLRADWALKSSEILSAPAATVTHVRKTLVDGREVTFHVALFNSKACTLLVIDHPVADHGDLSTAMHEQSCLAGVNGGYFQPDRTPLGLVISNGVTLHPLEHAKLLSGLVYATHDTIKIVRIAEFKPNRKIRQAVQAGPFLVDGGKPVPGLDDQRSAVRTVVLTDGKGTCALVAGGPLTLAETARVLANPAIISEVKVTRALNLDGGRSTGLWVDDHPKAFYLPEISSVRTYIGVVPKM